MTEPRTVHCKKLNRELPGLPFKPFPDDFGQLMFDNISMEAWQMWLKESPRYVNTYFGPGGYDLQSAEGRDFMRKQMRVYFGFDEGDLADTAWRPNE